MLIKNFVVGQISTNCYIVTDENTLDCAVIDPGDESNVIMNYIESNNLKVKNIFLTHGHFDHTGAVCTIAEETGAPVWINEHDIAKENDDITYKFKVPDGTECYSDGDKIEMAGLSFEIMETPGHSLGSVTIRCENALFTGDTLFRDSCGRTDLPGGDMDVLLNSLRRISALEDGLEVYPGHMEATDLRREKNFNYYVRYANGEK